jgi:hypothetical protein
MRIAIGIALTGIVGLGLATALIRPDAADPSRLVAHEWGTITTRHAPDGTPYGRLNRIDSADVLPAFVHRYEPEATRDDTGRALGKSPLTPGRPDVTMRLETPVIYFYPPEGGQTRPLNVSVRFRGGVLNEFYPAATASLEVDVDRVGAKNERGAALQWDGATLDNYVVGGLRWTGVALQDSVRIPNTHHHAWLAPRRVRATGVTVPGGEGERYLFYRGVAHLDAPFETQTLANEVVLRAPHRMYWLDSGNATISRSWFVDVRPEGTVAFRDLGRFTFSTRDTGAILRRTPLFGPSEPSMAGAAKLRASMKRALVDAGLFEDEAEAMLETWRDSYFRTPGRRILYVVPSEWVAYHLPLTISEPVALTRVIVGRIDLR